MNRFNPKDQPVKRGLAAAISAALHPFGRSTLVMEFVLNAGSALLLLDCSLPERSDVVLSDTTNPGDDYSGLDWLDMSIPYGHEDLPVVVFTHEGRLKDGRRVLERIVANGKAERMRLYYCGDPGLFAREKEDLIRSVADELDEFDEESALLMAAAWSGVCQAATIGRMAENEYERRQVVEPFRDTWIDGVELDTFVDILRGLPFNSLLEVETFAAALWNPVCMCKALAAAWAKSLHSTRRGASPAADAPGPGEADFSEPMVGNRGYRILETSWHDFNAEHGMEEPCLVCGGKVCPLLLHTS